MIITFQNMDWLVSEHSSVVSVFATVTHASINNDGVAVHLFRKTPVNIYKLDVGRAGEP